MAEVNKERGMFRVYICPKCGNIDHVSVDSESSSSKCSSCGHVIVDTPSMIYAVTIQEAAASVRELREMVEVRQRSRRLPRGRGTKRRIEDIISALVDLNHGRPVAFTRVLEECVDAGIDISRAVHFLTILEEEGRISSDGIVVEVKEDY